MIRVVIYLILVGLAAIGVAWLADRPGDVAITWSGYRIETSVMILCAAVVALMVAAVLLWSLIRTIINSPHLLARFMRDRRGARAYQAMSKGLIAVGAGDVRLARKFASEARRIAADEPLALLLSAQSAQLSGDHAAADAAFRAMAERPETKLLGLHGLFIEARRRGDVRTARMCAEEAASAGPTPGWAGQAVLELRCAAGDWLGALDILDRNYRSGLVDKPTYTRHRAVLLTARAEAAEQNDRDRAKPLALEAVKLAPGLVPAATLAARLLAENGEYRKSSRIVERAWREQPHPDLAETFAHLRSGDAARERLARAKTLAQKAPANIESALAVARAAIDAQEFSTARLALAPHLHAPTQRVALTMAELEQAEHGDEGRAREWTARAVHAQRDPAWTADGIVSERWLPVSPVTGRLDAFEWRVPVAELSPPRAQPLGPSEPSQPVAALPPQTDEPTAAAVTPSADSGAAPAPAPPKSDGSLSSVQRSAAVPERAAATTVVPPVEPITPLVRAPDDPGPEPQPEPAADRRHLHDLI